MHPVETYLKALSEIHRTGGGVPEESYYGALENLLNEVGSKLKPRVRAVSQLRNVGAGEPDFGLYTANQFQRSRDSEPIGGALPERGAVEVKDWTDDSFLTAKGEQVSKYWKRYSLVLVTNYRDFVLLGREAGRPVRLETLRLAESEAGFREMLKHYRKAATEHGERFLEFLRRAMLYEAALTDPEDLAWFLASYAKEARHRVEAAADLPALEGLKKGLEQALGMTFEGDKGEHFFQATLVQTLFYGIFSSWVLWSRDNWGEEKARFDWHNAAWTLHVPMIASLFDQIATPKRLKPLGVDEVLDWAGAVLNRADRTAFFSKFEQEHAVQYFYEPFLKAYDPELRKELGVWYTPPEIVQYQVERVDHVLREELNLPDGLADDRVVVLDPCCGTGAYLVEVLKRIHKTLKEKGASALTAQKLKHAAMERVFGFEILPAPFVVSHLQLGLMLRLLGAPLDHESDQRVGVYLTNALTGWEPPKKPKDELPLFPELMEERDAANRVKREAPILVILGNPPYNGFAGTAMDEERDLVTAYRTTKRAPKPEGQGLNDLYVRFFRMAERRIVDKSGRGVVCFISNYSWLEGLSHTGMRERYLEAFDRIWIDCLNGDKYKTGKVTPWGEPDPSIFSTESSREGIQVGTAIALLVRKPNGSPMDGTRCQRIGFRHLWGRNKHAEISRNTSGDEPAKYENFSPYLELGYPLMPAQVDAGYLLWPQLPDILSQGFSGVKTARDEGLVDIELQTLQHRMNAYYDPKVSDQQIESTSKCLMTSNATFDAPAVRKYLTKRGSGPVEFLSCLYRPFDVRWLCWEPETRLLDRARTEYRPNVRQDNPALILNQRYRKGYEPPIATKALASFHVIEIGSIVYPLQVEVGHAEGSMFQEKVFCPNLTEKAEKYLRAHGLSPDILFYHLVSTLHSSAYARANSAALRQDWPRIPLPAKREVLLASAALGRRVAALLDTEEPVDGVTAGKIDPQLKNLGVIRKAGGGHLNPDAGELDVTAGWGHTGKGGVCMPGRGRIVEREQHDEHLRELFGDTTLDVYLNGVAYWSNVPRPVWEYTIGGYQVIKKWLSYREKAMLGRGLKPEEAEYVTEMVRRIAALILLQPELDANYQAVKADTWPWPQE